MGKISSLEEVGRIIDEPTDERQGLGHICNSRFSVTAGAVAGPLFVVLYSIAGRREEKNGYDRRRDPVSAIVRSPGGWMQTVNFFATGSLFCLAARGLRRAAASDEPNEKALATVIGSIGAGLIGAGVFPTDIIDRPSRDRESATPSPRVDGPQPLTLTGALHTACAVPVFTGLPTACFVAAHRLRKREIHHLAVLVGGGGVASIVAATLHGKSYKEASELTSAEGSAHSRWTWLVDHGGTAQRIALVTGFGGLSAYLARLALRG